MYANIIVAFLFEIATSSHRPAADLRIVAE
jgi:hypothetical protein